MRAFSVSDAGVSPALVELDTPDPASDEVRVRVVAASVNGFDLAVAAGYMTDFFEHRYPLVLGREFVGIVDSLGDDVSGFEIGDRVFGVVDKPYLREGAFAEYTTASIGHSVGHAPENLSDSEAASLAHTGSTALHILDAIGELEGRTVLVVGATGGVGTVVVQLAAAAGANVIATGRTTEGRALLSELGAAATVDYEDLDAAVRAVAPGGVDAVVHLSGDPAAALALLKDGGVYASPIVYSAALLPGSERVVFIPIAGVPSAERLERLRGFVTDGRLRVIVDGEHSFDDVAAALGRFGSNTIGNIVVMVG